MTLKEIDDYKERLLQLCNTKYELLKSQEFYRKRREVEAFLNSVESYGNLSGQIAATVKNTLTGERTVANCSEKQAYIMAKAALYHGILL